MNLNCPDGIKVSQLKNMLSTCPDDAIVLLNHCCSIDFEEKDGKVIKHKAWVFDPIIEVACETIDDKERYPEWKDGDKIVWITHQVND